MKDVDIEKEEDIFVEKISKKKIIHIFDIKKNTKHIEIDSTKMKVSNEIKSNNSLF